MAEEATQEVAEATTEGENQDELNSILDALGKDDTVVETKVETPSGDEKPFKKIGDQVFKTEADYDAWALKNNGDVRRLTGELKKATEAVRNNPTVETKQDVNAIRMQIKVADFFESNPEAVEHKDVIAALLRSGKAKTLPEAYNGALRAAGIEVKEKVDDSDLKNVLKAGGSDGGVGAGSYNSQGDVQGTSDFADSALLGKY
jgi:hypothetical protein